MTPLRGLLVIRFTIFNGCVLAGLVAAWGQGLVQRAFEADASRISYAITALLAACLAGQAWRAWKLSRAFDALKRGTKPGGNLESGRVKALAKVEWMETAGTWLVMLGLLGTVVGFTMVFYGVDADSISADNVQRIVAALVQGMGVALYTTLVGIVAALWVDGNRRMIRTATICYWADAR